MVRCSVKYASGGHSLSQIYEKKSLLLTGVCALLKQTVSDPGGVCLIHVVFFLCVPSLLLQLKENGFPGDMALTPKESLQLYNTMVEKWCGKESLQVSR